MSIDASRQRKRKRAAEGLRAVAVPPPRVPTVVVADAVAGALDVVGRGSQPTLGVGAPVGQIPG